MVRAIDETVFYYIMFEFICKNNQNGVPLQTF